LAGLLANTKFSCRGSTLRIAVTPFGPSRFRDFFPVGSEEARVAALASVRRSNRTCSFPASGFHQGASAAGRKRRNQ